LTIVDEVTGEGTHRIELSFTVDAGCAVRDGDPVYLEDSDSGRPLLAMNISGSSSLERRLDSRWVSKGYGHREPAAGLVLMTTTTLPFQARTTLVPAREQDSRTDLAARMAAVNAAAGGPTTSP
jgi:hypothetical protein